MTDTNFSLKTRSALHPSELPVLLVDDEADMLYGVESILKCAGLSKVICCADSRRVMDILSNSEIGTILLDIFMPHVSGTQLLPQITQEFPEVPVLMLTGLDDIRSAVECMRTGAFDYLVKPVEEARLLSCVRRAIELRELRQNYSKISESLLSGELEHPKAFADIVTRNRQMESIFKYVETIASSPQPVLVTGETGTGKELIANAIHNLSNRKGKFVTVNVAGLDHYLFSDTLFGHARGAFTGAEARRAGLIEKAQGGSLFLDEIGDLDVASQVKLLRLVQHGDYLPLGSDLPMRTDARIIAATNRDLVVLTHTGEFRKDLYYRLQSHRIQLPALRERKDDLPLLLDHFLGKAAKALSKRKPTPDRELTTLLSTYHFPGNVRELEALVFEAVSQHQSHKLSTSVFRSYFADHRDSTKQFGMDNATEESSCCSMEFPEELPTIREAIELLIDEAMKRANNNQTIASGLLGISRQSLNRRLNTMRGSRGP